ncbi:hypothetical protein C4D60_Mb08t22060 [Musa balbisiana]|uniref:Uncharacterized protein n=1 Tax=Musa balbisiana TaxID=52838 RepID=A0A4S8K5K1_MUSBA|nr:hypothetical protein C4D60_Mb08t22060 [Musa balbisiana]
MKRGDVVVHGHGFLLFALVVLFLVTCFLLPPAADARAAPSEKKHNSASAETGVAGGVVKTYPAMSTRKLKSSCPPNGNGSITYCALDPNHPVPLPPSPCRQNGAYRCSPRRQSPPPPAPP